MGLNYYFDFINLSLTEARVKEKNERRSESQFYRLYWTELIVGPVGFRNFFVTKI